MKNAPTYSVGRAVSPLTAVIASLSASEPLWQIGAVRLRQTRSNQKSVFHLWLKSNHSDRDQTASDPVKPILNLFNPKNCRPLHGKAIRRFNHKSNFANACPSSICICPAQKLTRVSRCPSTTRKAKQAKQPQKKFPIFSGHFDGKSLRNPAKTAQKTLQIHAKNTQILPRLLLRVLAPLR